MISLSINANVEIHSLETSLYLVNDKGLLKKIVDYYDN